MGRKVWVLETSTKGTGANMVPLERVLESPSSNTTTPIRVPRRPRPRPAPEPQPQPRAPRRFKIEPKHERWRLLTVAEQGAMWELRDRQ